jgi:hypothetical protein
MSILPKKKPKVRLCFFLVQILRPPARSRRNILGIYQSRETKGTPPVSLLW